MKKLRVTVEGKVYEVLVEMLDEGAATAPAAVSAPAVPIASSTATVAPAAAAAPPAGARSAAGAGDVPSPLSGKIVTIDAKVGDSVTEGAQVATVEAMKMNTYIFAPTSGRVEAVLVNVGDGVEEGTVLMRLV